MSDVMRRVVQEALSGNTTIVSHTQAGQSSRGRANQGSNRGGSANLNNINRPNYQAMKKDRRLGPIAGRVGTGGRSNNTPNRVNSNYSPRQSVNRPANNRVQSNRPNANRATHVPTRRVNNPAPRRAAGAPVIKRSGNAQVNRSNAPAGRSNAPVSNRSNAPVGRRSNAPVGNRSNTHTGFRTTGSAGRISNTPVGRSSVLNRNDSSILPHSYNVDNVSRLSAVTLAQGKVSNHGHVTNALSKSHKLIGKTKDGGNIWFFENLNDELIDLFNRSISGSAIGVIEMPENLPSYLLTINEMIRKNQNIEFYVSWDKENEQSFLVELYCKDPVQLESILRDIYKQINRRSMKRIDSYVTSAPSPWLSKQLDIKSTVNSIAILEGIPYYTGVLLVNQALDIDPNRVFDYEINNNHLLITGDYQTVTDLVAQLKKLAHQL